MSAVVDYTSDYHLYSKVLKFGNIWSSEWAVQEALSLYKSSGQPAKTNFSAPLSLAKPSGGSDLFPTNYFSEQTPASGRIEHGWAWLGILAERTHAKVKEVAQPASSCALVPGLPMCVNTVLLSAKAITIHYN
jgi:hypothetical protein